MWKKTHPIRASLVLAVPVLLVAPPIGAALEEADATWAARAETLEGERAAPGATERAIQLYRAALEEEPESLEARWKLLRALHYLVDFSAAQEPRRAAASEQAIALAEDSLELLEGGAGTSGDRARVSFWSAIAWGVRAQRVGLLTLVREGVATRMHDHARRALELDPTVDRGGPLRLLSRLHADVPRVPFVSGWVDRGRVLPLAERAHDLDAEHPGNRLILALALLERAPERRAEAVELLRSVARLEPEGASRVEFARIREQAREKLSELGAAGPS